MYIFQPNIALLDLPKNFVDAVEQCSAEHRSSFLVTNHLNCSDLTDKVDVLLISRSGLENMATFKNTLKPECHCVLVQTTLEHIEDHFLPYLDDIWIVPDVTTFNFHFFRLLHTIRRQYTATFNQIFLDTLINSMDMLIWCKNMDGIYLKVNDHFCNVVGKPKNDVEGFGHAHIWGLSEEEYENSDVACKESDARTLEHGREYTTTEMVQVGKHIRQFSTTKNVLKNARGQVLGTLGIARDLIDFTSVAGELEFLLDSLPFAVLLIDNQEHILKANHLFKEFFAPEYAELTLGKSLYQNFIDRTQMLEQSLTSEVNRSHNIYTQVVRERRKLIRPSGEIYLDLNRKNLSDLSGNLLGSMITFRDITAEYQTTAHLFEEALTDALTGLYNRRYFFEHIAKDVHSGDTLVYLDIDKFKQLNDEWGHDSGDKALIKVATLLREICDVSTRLGGDEFVMYFSGISHQDIDDKLYTLAEDMQKTMKGIFSNLRLSIGLARATSTDTVDNLLYRADAAMYANKKTHADYYRCLEERDRAKQDHDRAKIEILTKQLYVLRPKIRPYTTYHPGMQANPDHTPFRTT